VVVVIYYTGSYLTTAGYYYAVVVVVVVKTLDLVTDVVYGTVAALLALKRFLTLTPESP